jgi:dienelactone hydrolase
MSIKQSGDEMAGTAPNNTPHLKAMSKVFRVALLVFMAFVVLTPTRAWSQTWDAKGVYTFDNWTGPPMRVFYSVPPDAGPDTRIVVVIPGARRNADDYRDQWHHLAMANGFIVLTIEGTTENYPTEWDYNAGGVLNADGEIQPEETRIFSVIEPMFDDFKTRFGSDRQTYGLYGHSAGGGFVHRFVLFEPDARFDVAIAANPAFFTIPDTSVAYPFGLSGASLPQGALQRWLDAPLVVMLADRDTGPRKNLISNSAEAIRQGPSVFARGLIFFHSALVAANMQGTELGWKIEVVQDVGHSNTNMASHAVKYLLD